MHKILEDYLTGSRLLIRERELGRDETDYRFDASSVHDIAEQDIRWFFMARGIDALTEAPNGSFVASRKGGREHLYSHGLKTITPRIVTVAKESIITIGAAGRLIAEFNWNVDNIGFQYSWNGSWPFDLFCVEPGDDVIRIMCEVKKSKAELDNLCTVIEADFAELPVPAAIPRHTVANAATKIACLRALQPNIFWALGPNGYERIYRIDQDGTSGALRLTAVSAEDLRCPVQSLARTASTD